MEKTSPKLLFNSIYLRFPKLLRTYQIHKEVFDGPFNFDAFYKTHPPGVPKPDQKFLEWFVGFSEGDGCFYAKGDRCSFSITQRDEPLLRLIQQTLGFGSIVTDRTHPGVFRYYISSIKKDVFPLIQLFNGNLLLKKTNDRFKSWVAHYNRRQGKEHPAVSRWDGTFKSIEHSSHGDPAFQEVSLRSTSAVWNSSWFAGFVEAEGCFSVNLGKPDLERLKFRRIPEFRIAQKGETELVLHIAFLMGRGYFGRLVGGARIPDRTLENGIYQFQACSGISLKGIQDYLESHPLRGKKALSYSKWRQSIVELSKFKELLRVCKASRLTAHGETRFPFEEYQKLLALVQDINPLEFKKRVGTRTSPLQAPREDL